MLFIEAQPKMQRLRENSKKERGPVKWNQRS